MATFEFNNSLPIQAKHNHEDCGDIDPRRIREECIIALKVYDACRKQDCLTSLQLGPARAAESGTMVCLPYTEGEIINPPNNSATVIIDDLRIQKVIIVSKKASQFKSGYWDIDLKYVFIYNLTFLEADGTEIGTIVSNSIFNKTVCLFGSCGTDILIATDLLGGSQGGSSTLDSEPFVLVEAKAVALDAKLRYSRVCDEDVAPEPNRVNVTIGLFSIIKLFRIVQLSVESKGFCIPPECEEISPLNPCEFFDDLDFPMDIFSPPQKTEFFAGISGNIPPSSRRRHEEEDCNCDD